MDALQVLTMTPMELVNKNLYVYCDGNPVGREDVTGAFWNYIASAALGAAFSVLSTGFQAMVEGRQLSGKEILLSAAVGAGMGLVSAFDPFKKYEILINSTISAIYAAATTEGSWEDKFCNGATAFVSSAASNLIFANYKPIKMQELGDFGVDFERKVFGSGVSVAYDAGVEVFKKTANHPYGNSKQYNASSSTSSNNTVGSLSIVHGASGGFGGTNIMLLMTK